MFLGRMRTGSWLGGYPSFFCLEGYQLGVVDKFMRCYHATEAFFLLRVIVGFFFVTMRSVFKRNCLFGRSVTCGCHFAPHGTSLCSGESE